MTARIGSLFSGSGMLDEGVRAVIGGDVAWHAEIDPAASKVLAYRYPDVPNLGDISTVDWAGVEPVDVITGGSPCQDVSHAGRRAGMRAGTRSGLWARMCDAIEALRPAMVVWENVRGVLSAEADSALEPCPGCVGDGDDGAVLRALGRVLGDLADLGYDTGWCGLRAADIGAPHGRFRVFVVARDAARFASDVSLDDGAGATDGPLGRGGRPVGRADRFATDAERGGRGRNASTARRGTVERAAATRAGALVAADPAYLGHERSRGARDGWAGSADGSGSAADAHGDALRLESVRELRSGSTSVPGHIGPDAPADATSGGLEGCRLTNGDYGPTNRGRHLQPARVRHDDLDWGQYAAAIRRWEHVTGQPAPAPTEPGTRGGQRLSPRLTEWMMGWPAGWVTDVPGVSRNDALRICGNGVVWQQAAEAIRRLLPLMDVAA